MPNYRRRLYFHAFVFLMIAFLLGFGAGAPNDHQKQWLVAHVSGLLTTFLLGLIGVVWPELRLSPGQTRVTYFLVVATNYYAFAVLGIFSAIVGAPLLVAPGPEVAPWANAVIVGSIVLVSIGSFAFAGLLLYGLRGSARTSAEASPNVGVA